MNSDAKLDGQNLNILLNIHGNHSAEIGRHLELGLRVFIWSTTLTLSATGFVILRKSVPDCLKGYLTISILSLFGVVCFWQRRNLLNCVDHAKVLDRISETLQLKKDGAYLESGAVYAEEWHLIKSKRWVKLGVSMFNISLLIMTACFLIVLWALKEEK